MKSLLKVGLAVVFVLGFASVATALKKVKTFKIKKKYES